MQIFVRANAKAAVAAALISLALVALSQRTSAAELLMFEHSGCPWCKLWHKDIGPIYPKTEEGKSAPLRRITFAPKMELDVILLEPVAATPTFVLVDNGKELGRLTGYKDAESFWGLLGILLQKLARDGAGAVRG